MHPRYRLLRAEVRARNALQRVAFGTGRWLLRIPRRLAAIPESPPEIAKAFAFGVFIGIMPGMGTVVALFGAVLLRLSKMAAVLGSLVTNPWTVPLFYGLSYQIGQWFHRLEQPIEWRLILTLQQGWGAELWRAVPPLITGCIILGALMAAAGYVTVRLLVTSYKKARLRRQKPAPPPELGGA